MGAKRKRIHLGEKAEVKYNDAEPNVGDAQDLVDFFPKVSWHAAFSSMNEMAKHVKGLNRRMSWHEAGWDNDNFYGKDSMEKVLKLAEEGWPEGVAQIDAMQKLIQAKRPLIAKPSKYGIAGVRPDVPRAISGDPLNMLRMNPKASRRKKTMTIVMNLGASCFVEQDTLTNRSAVMATLVDQIESMGFACELIVASSSYGRLYDDGDEKFQAIVSARIKESNQPVDIGKLAFALGHVGVFRRFVFATEGAAKECERGLGYGLGYPEEIEAGSLGEDIYIIPSMNKCHQFFKNEETASKEGLEFLINSLKKQKCPAFDLEGFVEEEEEDDDDEEDF